MIITEENKYYTCKYDRPFKEIMLNKKNEDILKILLKKILKVDIKEIVYGNVEQNTGNIKIRRKYYDVLLKTDKGEIEIELNAESVDYVHPRNTAYISSLYASHTLVGENYTEDTNIIQVNLSYGLNDIKDMRVYKLQDDEGKEFVKNLIVVEVNMDFYEKIWYDKDELGIEENKYLIMLNRNYEEQEEFKKYIKDKKVVRYMEQLNKLNESPIFREYMTYEEDQRKIFNSRMKEATEKGLEQGLEQGKIEIARNLLNMHMSVEDISKATDLSITQVEELINK